jgi:DNA-binding transcriptional LysR family regulator
VHQGNPKSMCKLAANNQVDFVIASEVIDERGELITIPAYRWNRCIVVPPKHALAGIKNISLTDLAEYPILTYMLGLSGRSQLDKSFQQANLEPRVAFTATDSDVIKTYVRLGMGAGSRNGLSGRRRRPGLYRRQPPVSRQRHQDRLSPLAPHIGIPVRFPAHGGAPHRDGNNKKTGAVA